MTDGVHGPYGASDGLPGEPQSTITRLPSGDQPRLRMRQLLSRLGAQKPPQALVLDPLTRVLKAHHPKADIALVEKAYRTAEHYHNGQLRKSGDAYITHPLAVATILAELGMNEPTICAALLHDTVEDTSYTVAQLTLDFGGACTDCPAAGSTLHERIETAVRGRYPGLASVARTREERRPRGWLGWPGRGSR